MISYIHWEGKCYRVTRHGGADAWEEITQAECERDHRMFIVRIYLGDEFGALPEDVQTRMIPKLDIVQAQAVKLAEAMLKGTLKYEGGDDLPLEAWIDHAESEAIDLVNYFGFIRESLR